MGIGLGDQAPGFGCFSSAEVWNLGLDFRFRSLGSESGDSRSIQSPKGKNAWSVLGLNTKPCNLTPKP